MKYSQAKQILESTFERKSVPNSDNMQLSEVTYNNKVVGFVWNGMIHILGKYFSQANDFFGKGNVKSNSNILNPDRSIPMSIYMKTPMYKAERMDSAD